MRRRNSPVVLTESETWHLLDRYGYDTSKPSRLHFYTWSIHYLSAKAMSRQKYLKPHLLTCVLLHFFLWNVLIWLTAFLLIYWGTTPPLQTALKEKCWHEWTTGQQHKIDGINSPIATLWTDIAMSFIVISLMEVILVINYSHLLWPFHFLRYSKWISINCVNFSVKCNPVTAWF